MELNDTILTATDTGIISETGQFNFSGEIGDNIYNENDVDLYSLTLTAGQNVVYDIDADINGSSLDSVLRLFDEEGNEVASDDDGFANDEYNLDSFIEYRATYSGQYYVGVSQYYNFDYDPTVEGSGDQEYDNGGDYTLKIIVDPEPILGTSGDDIIAGTSQRDIIRALEGNDEIQARAGDDTVIGGTGRDIIYGNSGNDSLFGSFGFDTLIGGSGRDTLIGAANRDVLFGGGQGDLLLGLQDRDTLRGENGNDRLLGGTSNDALYGGNGRDTINGEQGADRIFGEGGSDTLLGESGADTIRGGDGNDFINGGFSGDLLIGNNGNDVMLGAEGDDTLNGQNGSDTLRGQAEDDVLIGGSGRDLLEGGSGRDTMTGGTGVDSFVYENSRHGGDIITDFEVSDRFILTELLYPYDGNVTFDSANPFEDYVRIIQVGSGTNIRFDAGGDRPTNQFLTLATLQGVDASTITADNFVF